MKSPIYWHPKIYNLVMKSLEGASYNNKFEFLSNEIGKASLLDIGCGDCEMFKAVKNKEKYFGVDMNSAFIKHAHKKGIKAKKLDILKQPLPEGFDVILFSGILHQLVPHHESLITQALEKAEKKVIICEAETHLASSKNFITRKIANFLNNPGRNLPEKRLSKQELYDFYKKLHVHTLEKIGRNSIAIFYSSGLHKQG
jgi:trans-aconitate methyltransferase